MIVAAVNVFYLQIAPEGRVTGYSHGNNKLPFLFLAKSA
ncbi:hypothetical protein NOC27_880 [Nitrosococcus oceani AFC27]|nr:hypothetical protein NOC27_880 [Nitrosococcus oceani AFC27]